MNSQRDGSVETPCSTALVLLLLLLLLLASVACGPKRPATECDKQRNDCLRRCQITDSQVERDWRRDETSLEDYDSDSRTMCEQDCDDICD